jgi:hypothetical protein
MTKSATDVMQELVFAAVIDAVVAFKAAAKGAPNALLRDLNAVHANTTFGDLPEEVRRAIVASVRDGFSRLLREGYAVAPAGSAPPVRHGPATGQGPGRPHRPGGGPRPAGRPGGGKPRPPGRPGKPPRRPRG